MDREKQNRLYRAISQYTGSDSLSKILLAKDSEGVDHLLVQRVSRTTKQLLALCRIHSTLSNLYYDEAFAPSRDAYQLIECLYHTLSAYRYLTTLGMLLETTQECCETTFVSAFNKAFGDPLHSPEPLANQELVRLVRSCLDDDGDRKATFSDAKQMSTTLVRVRESLLRRLLRHWQRHQALMRRDIVADKLIEFCVAFKTDLREYASCSVRYANVLEKVGIPDEEERKRWVIESGANTKLCESHDELQSSVTRTLLKARFNKGDHHGVFKDCETILTDGGFKINELFVFNKPKSNPRKLVLNDGSSKFLEAYVTGVSANFRLLVEQGLWGEGKERGKFCGVELGDPLDFGGVHKPESVIKRFRASPSHVDCLLLLRFLLGRRDCNSRDKGAHLEVYLRICFLIDDIVLNIHSGIGCFARGSCKGPSESIEVLKRVRVSASDCLFMLKNAKSVNRPHMENMVIDEAEGSGLLVPYCSLFNLSAGRACALIGMLESISSAKVCLEQQGLARWGWLYSNYGETRDDERFPETEAPLRADGAGSSARWYRKAFKRFESGRSGLAPHDGTLGVFCDLHSVFAALMSSDSIALDQRKAFGQNQTLGVLAGQVTAKLNSAQSYLDTAREKLSRGSKTSLALLLYSYLLVRFSCQRSAVLCHTWVLSWPGSVRAQSLEAQIRGVWRDYAEIQKLARSGIRGIREGLDHTQPNAYQYRAELYRCWLELMFTTFVAMLLLGVRYKKIASDVTSEDFSQLLSEMSGLDAGQLGRVPSPSTTRGDSNLKVARLFEDFWTLQNDLEYFDAVEFAPQWGNIFEKALEESEFHKLDWTSERSVASISFAILQGFFNSERMQYHWKVGEEGWAKR